ncbi:hypothetical protein LCGC14_2639640, partial [marine sediment metagenome]
ALAEQTEDTDLQATFARLAKALSDNETNIIDDLNNCQGSPVDMGGYYQPDAEKVEKAMRPSATLNNLLSNAL